MKSPKKPILFEKKQESGIGAALRAAELAELEAREEVTKYQKELLKAQYDGIQNQPKGMERILISSLPSPNPD